MIENVIDLALATFDEGFHCLDYGSSSVRREVVTDAIDHRDGKKHGQY
jgi:hypothetical protein